MTGVQHQRRGRPREAAPGVLTRERILETASEMFAERGVEAVSLRELTLRAGVNLAAVNYHFGSKEGVLAEVFARSSKPIVKWRLDLLAKVERDENGLPKVEQVLEAYLRPALQVGRRQNKSFMKLRARLALERDETVRRILTECFDESSRRCLEELAAALPDLPRDELYWRFHFMMGSTFYTMADVGRIQSLSHGECDPSDVELALQRMIAVFSDVFRRGVEMRSSGDGAAAEPLGAPASRSA